MVSFLTRRILFILFVTILIAFAVHLGMRMVVNSEVRQPEYDLVRQSKLAWVDTRAYLRALRAGDWGVVRLEGKSAPVREVVVESYINSMGLLLVALGCGALAGLALGAGASLVKQGRLAWSILTLTVLGVSTPAFFAGLLLRQAELSYVAVVGRPLVSIAGFGWDFKHMLLPVLVLAARPLAYLTRASFLALNRALQEDYVRTAYAKGLSQPQAVSVHVLRNIAVPVLTAIGVSLRFSLGALPVVEFLFIWPGLGLRLLQAIDLRQTTLVVTLALSLGLTFMVFNLALDLLYRVVDPRLRTA